jgi:hypothetical protein
MRIIAFITGPRVVTKILRHLTAKVPHSRSPPPAQAGARRVWLGPLWPAVIDTPIQTELIAARYGGNVESIRRALGLNGLYYLPEGVFRHRVLRDQGACIACVSGRRAGPLRLPRHGAGAGLSSAACGGSLVVCLPLRGKGVTARAVLRMRGHSQGWLVGGWKRERLEASSLPWTPGLAPPILLESADSS